jgi:hypothetical protein
MKKICVVSSSFELESESITGFVQLMRLRAFRREREIQFDLFQTSYAAFLSRNLLLQNLREKLLKDKIITRRERKCLLERTILLEENLIHIRQAIISGTILLYQLCLGEIELFIKSFEPENVVEEESPKSNPLKKQPGTKTQRSVGGKKRNTKNTKLHSKSRPDEIEIRSVAVDNCKNFDMRYAISYEYSKDLPDLPKLPMDYSLVDDIEKKSSKQLGWQRFCCDLTLYKFLTAASEAIHWYQNKFLLWIRKRESLWRSNNLAKSVASLQRLNWLSSKYKYDTTDRDLHVAKSIQQANLLDLKEMFLWRCTLNINVYDYTTQRQHQYALSSSILDKYLQRHPASALAKLYFSSGLLNQKLSEKFMSLAHDSLLFTNVISSSHEFVSSSVVNSIKNFRLEFEKSNLVQCLSKTNKIRFMEISSEVFDHFGNYCNQLLLKWLSKSGSDFSDRNQFIIQKLENFSCALNTAKTEYSELRHIIDLLFDSKNPLLNFNHENDLTFDENRCNISSFLKVLPISTTKMTSFIQLLYDLYYILNTLYYYYICI